MSFWKKTMLLFGVKTFMNTQLACHSTVRVFITEAAERSGMGGEG